METFFALHVLPFFRFDYMAGMAVFLFWILKGVSINGSMKDLVLDQVIRALEDELARRKGADEQASRGAMDSAPRAEKQRDTTGLEAAYLAHGHARQANALVRKIEELRGMVAEDFSGQEIDVGAMVEVEINGDVDCYILLNCAGGTEVSVDGKSITVITPESPLGQVLMGNIEAGFVSLPSGAEGIILDVF
jgi:hypothetical protein